MKQTTKQQIGHNQHSAPGGSRVETETKFWFLFHWFRHQFREFSGICLLYKKYDSKLSTILRFDVGVTEVKKGVDIVRKQIRGRGLPLDDEALDSITNVVYDALDAYEDFNEIRRK